MKNKKTVAAALSALMLLTACSGAGEDYVITGSAADSVQTQTTSAETADTAAAAKEDVSQIYYSYADLLRENKENIDAYVSARDAADKSEKGDAVAAVVSLADGSAGDLIFVAGDPDGQDYWISIYTHEGNRNRRIGHFRVFDGSADSTFCAFQDADSADFCLYTGIRDDGDMVYTYTQYEISDGELQPVETASKREGQTVTYTHNGKTADRSDFYDFRGALLSDVHAVFMWNFRGFDGDPWDTFLSADSLGMNYDDAMFYLDHTYTADHTTAAAAADDMLFPDSDRAYIFNDSLEGLSDSELRRAVNEIYARHGMIFNDSTITDYFLQFSWYNPKIAEDSFDENEQLNDYERANIAFMTQYIETKENAEKEASEEAARKASEEAARKATEEAARKASEEAAQKASEEAARKASEEAARKASEEAAKQAGAQQSASGSGENHASVSLATALSSLRQAVGTSIDGHSLQYEFTAAVNDASGRQYYAFTVTRMEGGAWVFYRNYLVAVDGTGYAADASQSGRPSYQHGSTVSLGSGINAF